jgi:hypothetical protein
MVLAATPLAAQTGGLTYSGTPAEEYARARAVVYATALAYRDSALVVDGVPVPGGVLTYKVTKTWKGCTTDTIQVLSLGGGHRYYPLASTPGIEDLLYLFPLSSDLYGAGDRSGSLERTTKDRSELHLGAP